MGCYSNRSDDCDVNPFLSIRRMAHNVSWSWAPARRYTQLVEYSDRIALHATVIDDPASRAIWHFISQTLLRVQRTVCI